MTARLRVTTVALCLGGLLTTAAVPAHGQGETAVSTSQTLTELSDERPQVRLRAVERIEAAPFDDAAVPLARAIVDADDAVQMAAIGAELNVFLAEKLVPRRRVGFVVEIRQDVSAQSIFEQGSAALDPRPVPADVFAALRTAGHDEHPRVAVEALYAFGALGANAYGAERTNLLVSSSADLAATLGSSEAAVRTAALRVITRVYTWHPGDPGMPQVLGDAVVTMLNDRLFAVRTAAFEALGTMRYARGVQALTDIYHHYERGSTASAALAALARIAYPASEELFTAGLANRDLTTRTSAIEGLARIGAVSQAAAIAQAIQDDRRDEVRLAGAFANVLLSNGPMDDLVEGLTHGRTRERALQYLAEAIPGRTPSLAPHMADPDLAVRVDLLEAVGLSGDPAAVSLIDRVREDEDPAVSRAVRRADARLGRPDSAQP